MGIRFTHEGLSSQVNLLQPQTRRDKKIKIKNQPLGTFSIYLIFETKNRHADTKAQEAIDHLASFRQVERRFHNRELNRQPLPRNLGISPPPSSSLGLSRTIRHQFELATFLTACP